MLEDGRKSDSALDLAFRLGTSCFATHCKLYSMRISGLRRPPFSECDAFRSSRVAVLFRPTILVADFD